MQNEKKPQKNKKQKKKKNKTKKKQKKNKNKKKKNNNKKRRPATGLRGLCLIHDKASITRVFLSKTSWKR